MKIRTTVSVCAVALALSVGAASAANLGVANDYNVFVLGDASQQWTDSEGSVAIGGNATYQGYGVASSSANSLGIGLAVAGNLDYQNGQVFNGNVYVGGSAHIYNGGNIQHGSLVNGNPIDFAAAGNYLKSSSAAWSALANTGSVANNWGTITLTGTSNTLNVFNVAGADMNSCNTLNINAPVGSTVLVNVSGISDFFGNRGVNLTGVSANNVLYNYFEAKSLTISGVGVKGSLLAAEAAVDFSSANIDGTLIAASVRGGGEAHNYAFTGDITAVPEPSSILAALSVLGPVGLVFRKRSK